MIYRNDKRAIGYDRALEQTVAAHRYDIGDAGVIRQDFLDLCENGSRARQGRAIGQSHINEKRAPILRRYEAGG